MKLLPCCCDAQIWRCTKQSALGATVWCWPLDLQKRSRANVLLVQVKGLRNEYRSACPVGRKQLARGGRRTTISARIGLSGALDWGAGGVANAAGRGSRCADACEQPGRKRGRFCSFDREGPADRGSLLVRCQFRPVFAWSKSI